jgi:hypothetical protein
MPASVTWVGSGALKKESEYSKALDNITEYTETWTGNPLNVAWPNYVIGSSVVPTFGSTNLGNLVWYSADAEQGKNKALASYVARASNRFDLSKAKWSLEQTLDTLTYKPLPGHEQQSTFSRPFMTAVISKVSYSPSVPVVDFTDQYPSPAPPFSIIQSLPPYVPFHTNDVTYGWVKTSCDPSLTKDGWLLTERWKYMVVGSD